MKKFVSLFILCVFLFFILLGYSQNSIIVSVQGIKSYNREINFIVSDYNKDLINENNVNEYINRVKNIKMGFSNNRRPNILNNYFSMKIDSLKYLLMLLENINDKENIQNYIDKYNYHSNASQKEIENILKSTFIRVTYLQTPTYYRK
ncbi:hypothetical protein [Alkalithermobacter paradoxus]|uniref:Uncharacterized protein n=1 Tax=Alkalithermobacter paradoxus TaxID=29349 RepID=A0A1V4IA39_9FIRM|nr:hypothetical protein CLOTH_09000 [[Clostridium] thermoalcaliphilum]